MTVCVAAICFDGSHQVIVGASDRMVTAGDIEFEPPQSKVFQFTNSIIALVAGDTTSQISICQNTYLAMTQQKLTTVKQIAEEFAKQYALFRLQQAEKEVLQPLGLELSNFVTQLNQASPDLLSRIVGELRRYDIGSETIITGIDQNGAHVYVVTNPGSAKCFDGIGFAVIGGGYWHAASQFMFSRYERSWKLERALLLTYSAKKRAEVAPGVGEETDMIYIGATPEPSFAQFGGDHILLKKLDELYTNTRTKHDAVNKESYDSMEAWVSSLNQEQQKQQDEKKKDVDK